MQPKQIIGMPGLSLFYAYYMTTYLKQYKTNKYMPDASPASKLATSKGNRLQTG